MGKRPGCTMKQREGCWGTGQRGSNPIRELALSSSLKEGRGCRPFKLRSKFGALDLEATVRFTAQFATNMLYDFAQVTGFHVLFCQMELPLGAVVRPKGAKMRKHFGESKTLERMSHSLCCPVSS